MFVCSVCDRFVLLLYFLNIYVVLVYLAFSSLAHGTFENFNIVRFASDNSSHSNYLSTNMSPKSSLTRFERNLYLPILLKKWYYLLKNLEWNTSHFTTINVLFFLDSTVISYHQVTKVSSTVSHDYNKITEESNHF